MCACILHTLISVFVVCTLDAVWLWMGESGESDNLLFFVLRICTEYSTRVVWLLLFFFCPFIFLGPKCILRTKVKVEHED